MKIGKIISVEYDKFRVRLFHTTRNSTVNIDGKVYYFGNIGSYLKTLNSSGEYIMCEVVSIIDWVGHENQVYSTYNLDSSREIIIKPIGTLVNEKFCMGVGIFPSLYSDVEIVTFNDLDLILSYNEGDAVNGVHSTISIGTSKSLINYSIELDINRFFNIHSAVLGNSGSGKSNTIAHILHEVYRKHGNEAIGAKTIIFDANGEYPMALGEEAHLNNEIESVFYKPNISDNGVHKRFVLPYYLMNLDEWLSFLMASERTQKPFWDRVLQESYKFYSIFNADKRNDAHRFANYIKWKLRQMLFNIVSRIDSDTSKMTAAKGAVATLRQTCNNSLDDDVDNNVLTDLANFLNACNDLCVINFGNNNDSLSNALDLFTAIDSEPKYVCVIKYKDHCDTKLSDTVTEGAFRQIDENDALLSFLHIISSRCQKLGDYAFYILSDISSFRERRRIRNRQRHIQKLRQRLDQVRFSASGRSQHQDVGFLNLRFAALHLHSLCRRVFRLFFRIFICPKLVLLPENHALIMVVDCH